MFTNQDKYALGQAFTQYYTNLWTPHIPVAYCDLSDWAFTAGSIRWSFLLGVTLFVTSRYDLLLFPNNHLAKFDIALQYLFLGIQTLQ